MLTYLLAHVVFGVLAGVGLQYLIAAGRKGKFSAANWIALGCFYALAYWFSGYVGGHVRSQAFASTVQGLSVLLMAIAFLVGYVARARIRSSKQR